MDTTKKKSYWSLNIIAMLMIYLCSGAGTMESAAIQSCIEAWPDVAVSSIRALITLSSLVCIPVMLFVSPFIGNKVSYKTAMMSAVVFISVGGTLPFFIHPSWGFVLFCRVLVGIGAGLIGPRNAMISKSLPLEARAKYIGQHRAIM